MQTRILIKLSFPPLGLLLLAACAATQITGEWRDKGIGDIHYRHLIVVALFKQDRTRRMFEDEFARQISNMGPMVTRSYNLTPVLNAGTTGQMPVIAQAMGADGALVIRMIAGRKATAPADDCASTAPMDFSKFLQYSWKDNYDLPEPMTNAAMTVESRLLDVKSGKLIWSLVTESENQFGWKLEIELLAKRVLARLKTAMRTKKEKTGRPEKT
jgi:hypothetical protein